MSPHGAGGRLEPWVELRYFTYNSCVYPRFLGDASAGARPGDWVSIYDKKGELFGAGFFNPRARVPLRVLAHSREPVPESACLEALRRAAELRRGALGLDARTDTYRVVNSDGDGLSGLIVDRFGEVLVVEVHSLGVYQRLDTWLPVLHEALGTRTHVLRVGAETARIEGLPVDRRRASAGPARLRVHEDEVVFEVDLTTGHKTGFFCDQRENRRRLAAWTRGGRVLDLCCYTGGFSLHALRHGGAAEATGVDLDEDAVAQARRNANLNVIPGNRARWIHADAFGWTRQMQANGERWDVVVLDPPKLVASREVEGPGGRREGRQKYEDLNRLAIEVTRPGGLLVTCSCSGLVTEEDFTEYVVASAHRLGRRLQFLDRTGAAPDHPVMSHAPEGRYLKVLWARVH